MTLNKYTLPIPAVPAGKEGTKWVNAYAGLNDHGKDNIDAITAAGEHNPWSAVTHEGMEADAIAFWQAIRGALITLTKQQGKLHNAAVLFEDLKDINMVKEEEDSTGGKVYTPSSPEEIEELLDTNPPPTPSGLSLVTSINAITLSWSGYNLSESNVAYASIYRSTSSDRSTAVSIGISAGHHYIDKTVADGSQYYYWVRCVSTSGVTGNFNSTTGTGTYLELTPTAMIDELAKQVSAQQAVGGAEVWKFDNNLFAIETLSGDLPFIIETVDSVSKIALNGETWIADAHIETAKIASLDVEEAKIADAAIATAKVDTAAVVNAKINDAAIQTAKIDDAQVETLKIGEQEVTVTQVYENMPITNYSTKGIGGWFNGGAGDYPISEVLTYTDGTVEGGQWSDYHEGLRLPYLSSANGGNIYLQFPIISMASGAFIYGAASAWVVAEISVWLGGEKRASYEPGIPQRSIEEARGSIRNTPEYVHGPTITGSPFAPIPAVLPYLVSVGPSADNSADPYIYVKARYLAFPWGSTYLGGFKHTAPRGATSYSPLPRIPAWTGGYNIWGEPSILTGGYSPDTGTWYAPGYQPASYNLITWQGYTAPTFGKMPLVRVFEAKR